MTGQDLIVAPTQSRPPTLIEGSGRKARDRIEHKVQRGACLLFPRGRNAYPDPFQT